MIVTLFAAATLAAPGPPPKPVLTDDVIKKAVRETIADDPQPAPVKHPQAGAFRADAVTERMTVAFEQAKVPDCLHDNALKHQPAQIGPVKVVGPYTLPWLVSAAIRGKCL